jgi:hypothetical protein
MPSAGGDTRLASHPTSARSSPTLAAGAAAGAGKPKPKPAPEKPKPKAKFPGADIGRGRGTGRQLSAEEAKENPLPAIHVKRSSNAAPLMRVRPDEAARERGRKALEAKEKEARGGSSAGGGRKET